MNSCFFILFWSNVYFFLLFQIVDLSPSFLPFTLGSLYIFLYFTFHSLHFFLYFMTILNQFCEHWITNVLNSVSDRLAISSSLSSIFGVLMFFHLGHISLSWWACYIASDIVSLRYSPGCGNAHLCFVALCVGDGSKREQSHLLGPWSAFNHLPHYPQANWALLVLIPGWVCLCTF